MQFGNEVCMTQLIVDGVVWYTGSISGCFDNLKHLMVIESFNSDVEFSMKDLTLCKIILTGVIKA
jgi:hypothetical protein